MAVVSSLRKRFTSKAQVLSKGQIQSLPLSHKRSISSDGVSSWWEEGDEGDEGEVEELDTDGVVSVEEEERLFAQRREKKIMQLGAAKFNSTGKKFTDFQVNHPSVFSNYKISFHNSLQHSTPKVKNPFRY